MKYNDKVKVIGGCFEGQEGKLRGFTDTMESYSVELYSKQEGYFTRYIEEKDLELIK